MVCEAGVRLTVGAVRVQGALTFSVVVTVLEAWGEWAPSELEAVTAELSVPVDLPDTA
jgi:hypothetical protein